MLNKKNFGEMAEWSIALPWKGSVGATLPWVRIPLSPPIQMRENFFYNLKKNSEELLNIL